MEDNASTTDVTTVSDAGVLANKRLVLEEQRRAFDKVYQAGDILDQKLQSLLQSAGLIIALVGIIQFPRALEQGTYYTFVILFAIALLLFIGMVAAILIAFQAREYLNPISRDWKELRARFFEQEEEAGLNQAIHDHIDSNRIAYSISARKDRLLAITTVLFGAIVVDLVLILFFTVALQSPRPLK